MENVSSDKCESSILLVSLLIIDKSNLGDLLCFCWIEIILVPFSYSLHIIAEFSDLSLLSDWQVLSRSLKQFYAYNRVNEFFWRFVILNHLIFWEFWNKLISTLCADYQSSTVFYVEKRRFDVFEIEGALEIDRADWYESCGNQKDGQKLH